MSEKIKEDSEDISSGVRLNEYSQNEIAINDNITRGRSDGNGI